MEPEAIKSTMKTMQTIEREWQQIHTPQNSRKLFLPILLFQDTLLLLVVVVVWSVDDDDVAFVIL